MKTAVVGVFDDPQAANRARDELVRGGFAEGDVMIHINDASEVADQDGSRNAGEADAGPSLLGEIFSSLFDFDGSDQRTGRLADAIRRGGFLVVVEDAGGDRARAMRIIESCGSIEVGEYSY